MRGAADFVPGDGVKQQVVFFGAASVAVVLALVGVAVPRAVEVSVLAAAVLVLGVPHGALDVLHARRAWQLDRPARWAVFLLVYVLLAAAVVAAWVTAPSTSLVGLLVISAFHFSGDLESGTPVPLRIVHGLAPICLPALLHAEALGELFAALATAGTAADLVRLLEWAARPLLAATVLSVAWAARRRRHRRAALEVLATAAVCAIAPPLVGFGVYFCLLHSWRHVARTNHLCRPTPAEFRWAAGLPTVATGLGAGLAFFLLEPEAWATGLVQVVFVGLAELTVPHMLLIERIRLAGWQVRPRAA